MSFAQGFNKWRKYVGLSMDQAVRAVTLDTATRIGFRSPVYSGLYLANHRVNVGSIDRSTTQSTTNDRNAVVTKALQVNPKAGDIIYISNSLPYARRLEYDAWSAQARGGIYRLAAMDTRNNINSIVREAGL